MSRILNTCIEVLPTIPLFLLVFRLMQKQGFLKGKKTPVYLVFSIYLAAMYTLVGMPSIRYIRFDANYNFVPFLYMFSDWENSLLNLLLFMPLGFFLPILWEKYRSFFRTVLFGFGTSLAIEVLQLFTYRATDVNDLMTNTLGTILGYAAARIVLKLLPAIVPEKEEKNLHALCGMVLGIMFFLQPFLSSLLWNIIM